jgi:signal transduction histidine kinase
VVAERVAESVRRLLDVPSAVLMLQELESDDLVAIATSGGSALWDRADLTLEAGMGALGLAVRTRQPVVTDDLLGDPRITLPPEYRSRLEATSIGSSLAVPMIVKGEVIGGLSLDDRRGRWFDPEDVLLAQTFADEAALALEHARLFNDLQTSAAGLEALSRRMVDGLEQQRQHLARELHDEVGQLLTGITLSLDTAARSATAPTAEGLMQARELVNETIACVREMALDLRPPMLDDLGLVAALVWHFERFARQTGLTVDFKQRGLDKVRASPQVESAVYRIAQEALTNVARHSGARAASVRLSIAARFVRLDVEDQGVGFDAARALSDPYAIGLTGMRERARLLGGELRIDSVPGAGTTVSASLPVVTPRGPGP